MIAEKVVVVPTTVEVTVAPSPMRENAGPDVPLIVVVAGAAVI